MGQVTRRNDGITYVDANGKTQTAGVVAVYDITTDMTVEPIILNMVSEAGDMVLLVPDEGRQGLTIRNDGSLKMYMNFDKPAASGVGYPLDVGRGYSFDATRMLPRGEIHIWCSEAGHDVAVMLTTTTEMETGNG